MRSKTLRKKLCLDEIVFQIFLKIGMHGEVTIVTDKGPFIFYERGAGAGAAGGIWEAPFKNRMTPVPQLTNPIFVTWLPS